MCAKKANFSKYKSKEDTLYHTGGQMQKQTIPENSNEQTNRCLTGYQVHYYCI